MDLKQLQSFVAVVKYESFTKAAAKLKVSQPTISTHVRALEEELGIPLVLRIAKRVELTPQGSKVYEQATTMLMMRSRILEISKSRETNTIYLGASSIPSAYILPEVLPEYERLHPEIRFIIHQHDTQEIVSGLVEGIYDVGLIGMPADEGTLECTAFCPDQMVLVTSGEPRFASIAGDAHEVASKILTSEHVLLRREGSASRATMDRILEGIGVDESDLDVIARVNDQETIKNLVASGLGVTIASARAVANRVKDGALLQFELPCAAADRNFYISFRKNSQVNENARDFVTYLRMHYA